ncbi:hypothetical protein JCM10450v2_006775 [Rhodotorula kratochvilovae]
MVLATALFNGASLDVVLAASPALIAASPPPTSLHALDDAELAGRTDAWAQGLLAAPRRPGLYYDERVTFHLVLALAAPSSAPPASPALSRAQAATLLLRSLPTPHLALAADLSYVDAALASAPPPLPARNSSLAGAGVHPRAPLTPAPFSALAGEAADDGQQEVPSLLVAQGAAQLGGVQVASVQFDDCGEGARVWVAKGRKEGEWVGVWEFSCDVDVNLLSALAPISSVPLHLPFSRLPASYLPPIPPPTLPVPRTRTFSVSHTRTLSAGSASGAGSSSSEAHHPSLRRSIRRILPIRPALQLDLRTVPCPVGALSAGRGSTDADDEPGVLLCVEVRGPAHGDEAFEIEHIDVLVEGAASSSSGEAGAGAASDIDVRPVLLDRLPSPWPVRIAGGAGGAAQHNFVYALAGGVALAAGAGAGLTGDGSAEERAVRTVPREVATSPQQRFAARFGAEEAAGAGAGMLGAVQQGARRGSQAQVVGGREGDSQERRWLRDVTVVVKGRPVLRRRKRERAEGYAVPDVAGADHVQEAVDEEEWEEESPMPAFLSRWHCTLDISSFARRAPPRSASFEHPSAPPLRPTSLAAPPLVPPAQAAPRLPLRPAAANVEVESIAGSKRHTMSSLAALSLRSPVMARKASLGLGPYPAVARPSLDRAHSTRALPPTPLSPPAPAPAPAQPQPHGAKRFFSLPHANHPHEGGSASAPPLIASHVATPVRTETPPPMHAPTDKRASLPPGARGASAGALLDARPKEVRRTSWMSGLVPGASAGAASAPPAAGRTSWDAQPPPAGVGLGLDDPSLAPGDDVEGTHLQEPQPQRMGKLLVSVSLVPLRTAKSRRAPAHAPTALERTNENLPPAVLPGLAAPEHPPHATPRFAFPPSPSPSSSPSMSPLPSPTPGESPAAPSSPVPPLSASDDAHALRALAEQTNLATSRMPRVNVLDVFLIEVFVFNRSSQVKRLTVGVPPAPVAPVSEERGRGRRAEKVARLVPLENDVRIGPLAPNSCASVGIRFLAIRPGAHVVEELRLVDLADGSETRLERPVWVVVE